MSHHNKNSKERKSSDGKNKDAKSNFIQQCKLGEAKAKASPELRSDDEDSVSAAILSELKTFRRENNEAGDHNVSYDFFRTICRENGGTSDPRRKPD